MTTIADLPVIPVTLDSCYCAVHGVQESAWPGNDSTCIPVWLFCDIIGEPRPGMSPRQLEACWQQSWVATLGTPDWLRRARENGHECLHCWGCVLDLSDALDAKYGELLS